MAAASCCSSCGQRRCLARHGCLCPCHVPALPLCGAQPSSLLRLCPVQPHLLLQLGPLPRLKGPPPLGRHSIQLPAPADMWTSRVPIAPRLSPCSGALGAGHRSGTQVHVSGVWCQAAVAPWTCHVGRVPSRHGPVCSPQARGAGALPSALPLRRCSAVQEAERAVMGSWGKGRPRTSSQPLSTQLLWPGTVHARGWSVADGGAQAGRGGLRMSPHRKYEVTHTGPQDRPGVASLGGPQDSVAVAPVAVVAVETGQSEMS